MVPLGNTWTAPVAVAQDDGAQVDLLDDPGDAVDPRQIADPHLILEDQEEAGDDVAHQVLRAEADRQPGNAGAGQDRQDVDQSSRSSIRIATKPTDDGDDAGQDAAERRGAALPFEMAAAAPCRRASLNCRCSIARFDRRTTMNAPTTMMTRLTPCVISQWPSSRGSQLGSPTPNRLSASEIAASAATP